MVNYADWLLGQGPEDVHTPVRAPRNELNVFQNLQKTEAVQVFNDVERPERSLSWTQYKSAVKSVAVGLQEIGVTNSDCVSIVGRNDIYYYLVAEAVISIGAVIAPLAALVTDFEMEHQLRVVYSEWVFAEPEFLDQVATAAGKVGIPRSNVLVFDAQEPTTNAQHKTLSQLLQADETKYHLTDVDDKHPAYRFLTSGSTGVPKAAELSHEAMMIRATALGKVPPFPHHVTDHPYLHFIDMHHISAWFGNVWTCLGKKQYFLLRNTDVLSWIDTVEKHKIVDGMIHPHMIERIVKAVQEGKREKAALASIRYLRVAGSALRTETSRLFKEMLNDEASIWISYGATEMGTITNISPGIPVHPGFCGVPIPGVEVMIIDPETTQEVPAGVEGEVCAKSISLFNGYVNNPEATQKTLLHNSRGTWLRTGDKGYWSDSIGQLALTGRFKEIFRVETEEVAPEEVEGQLLIHPGIVDAAVTFTDARKGQEGVEPLAYVVAPDESVSAQKLVDHIASRLSLHKAPTGGVVFCERIPRTSFGKLQRLRLNDMREQIGYDSRSARYLTPTVKA